MTTQVSGVKLVAQDGDRFITTITKAGTVLKQFEMILDSVAKQDLASTLSKAQTSATSLASGLEKVSRSGKEAKGALEGTGTGAEKAEGSIAQLRDRAKQLRAELENLSPDDANFQKLTTELNQANSAIKVFQTSVRGSAKSTEFAEGSYRQLNATLGRLRAQFRDLSAEERRSDFGQTLVRNINKLDTELKNLDRSIGNNFRNVGNYRQGWTDFASEIPGINQLLVGGLAGGLGVLAVKLFDFAKDSRQTAIDFETAFTGVSKTIDGVADSAGRLTDLGREIRSELVGLTRDIPASFETLAGVAELGGQLGVNAGNIVAFTETIALLGATTNLTEEQAGTALAQLANILGSTADDIERTGSALVELGNNSATTETEIVSFSQRIAATGAIVGLTEDQILGISAAFASVGISAEAGGTAVSKGLQAMSEAVANGGEELALFAQVAGQTEQEFADLFREDAAEAFTQFVEGLSGQGEQAGSILKDLGLGSAQSTRAFLALGNAGDLLADSLALAADGFNENTALAAEATAQFSTTENQTVRLSNAFTELKAALGGAALGTGFIADLTNDLQGAADSVTSIQDLTRATREFFQLRSQAREVGIGASDIRGLNEIAGNRTEQFVGGREIITQAQLQTASSEERARLNNLLATNEALTQEEVITTRLAERNKLLAQSLQLINNGQADTAESALRLAQTLTQVNERGQQGRGGRASSLAQETSETEALARANEQLAQSQLEEARAQEEQARAEEVYQNQLAEALEIDQERQRVATQVATALQDETITREQAVSVLTDYYGNVQRAENILDQEIQTLEDSESALDTFIEQNAEAAAQAEKLANAVAELRSNLAGISADAQNASEGIISDLVSAETDEERSTQLERLSENRRQAVSNLLQESGDLTFDQTVDLRLAFGEISLEEAELFRIEQEFFNTVNSLFGAESVIELGDRAVSVGSLIVQNSGAETAAAITDQIEALVTAGQGGAVNAVIEIVPELVASGALTENAIGDFVQEFLGGVEGGATAQEAVQIAIEAVADTVQAEASIDALTAKTEALAGGDYTVDTSTNAEDTANEIDAAQVAADLLEATDPDVNISTNAGQATGEVNSVQSAISSIERNVTVTIRANRVGDFSGGSSDGPRGFTEFMDGGFTGQGDRREVAGLVHRGEFVASQALIAQGPNAVVAAMMRQVPGFGASVPSSNVDNRVTINNNQVTNNSVNQGVTNQIGQVNARGQTARQFLSDFNGVSD